MSEKDFLTALQDAQKMPELPDELQGQVPDLLSGVANTRVVSRITDSSEGRIPFAKEYAFTYHCARFIIGKVSSGYLNGQEEYEEHDDTLHLKEIMDQHLSGKAIITKKIETFLKDGTVVIWAEWMLPKGPPPKEERDYLTEGELRSPELSNDSFDNSGES